MTAAPAKAVRPKASVRPREAETPLAAGRGGVPRSLDDLVGFNLRRAHTLFALHWQQTFRDRAVRVTPVQGGILLVIGDRPGLSQAALAAVMDVEGPTVVQVLDRMEAAGLIRRVRRATDRRSYALALTDAGTQALAAVKEVVSWREADLLSDLDDEERALLLHLLRRVVSRAHAVTDAPAVGAAPRSPQPAEAPSP